MKGFSMSQTRKNRIMVFLALVLFAALLIPQLSWASGRAAAVPGTCTGLGYAGAGDLAGYEAPCGHYFDLLERYQAGELDYHPPGR